MGEAPTENRSDIESETTVNDRHKSGYQSLRIWPPVLLIIGMLVLKYLPAIWANGPSQLWIAAAFGPLLCGMVIVVWWLVASRASILEKLVGLFGLVALTLIVLSTCHPTMRGPATMMVTIPLGMVGFAAGCIFWSKHLSFRRTALALLLATAGFGFSLLLRSEGMWGGFDPIFDWRWNPSAEELMLAENEVQENTSTTELGEEVRSDLLSPQWSGFRGNKRDGVVTGTKYSTDWQVPPEELWRIKVGPGWGSFVVAGQLLFTQEQRGDDECVVCYASDSGRQIWVHALETRFFDPIGGAGPRATPTLKKGKLFAMGANGFLICLNPETGDLIWKVDLRQTANVEPPMWGFSASPLIVSDLAIIHATGKGDKGVLAFDVNNGDLKWNAPSGRQSYSSPHLCKINGKPYVVMVTDNGMSFITPETGTVVSEYEWKQNGYRSLQPYVIDDHSILLATGMGAGTRRVQFDDELKGTEIWTSMALKPDFNDLVVHNGSIYGFDGTVFTCIDLETGDRNWKRGRYGKGQCVLLKDSNAILVLTEKGDAVLVEANAEQHIELGRIESVLPSKTWNHPAVVNDRMYIRNDREAACYKLPLTSSVKEELNDEQLRP